MSDADDYIPVEHTPKPEAVTAPVPDGTEERQPKMQRVISDSTRKAFQALAAKHAEGPLETDTLVPVDTKPEPKPEDDLVPVDTAAPAATPPSAPAIAVPAAGAALVEPSAAAADAAAKAIAEQQRAQFEAREKELAARADALEAERKKLPSRETWIDNAHGAMEAMVKEALGLSDEEYKDWHADYISESTAKQLGVPLDERVRTAIDARRARYAVRGYTAEQKKQAELLKAEQAKIAEEQKKLNEQQAEAHRAAQAKTALRSVLTPAAKDYPFLFANHDGADPHEVVYHVLVDQRDAFVKKYGEGALPQFKADWQSAAKLANDYYKNHYDTVSKRYATLLAPTAPATAPATAKPSPQVSAQVPRSTTQEPSQPTAQPETPPDAQVDWRTERARRRRAGLEKRFSGATPEE